jgi:hypothetical protein
MKTAEDYIQDLEKDLAQLRTDYKRENETIFIHCPCGCCGQSATIQRRETHDRSLTFGLLEDYAWPEDNSMIQ